MANEPLPITAEVLIWARERSGIRLEEAEAKFPRLGRWEKGDLGPTYPQLERLADYFHVPVAVFFFPEPPDLPPVEETFRTLREEDVANLPPRVRYLLRHARAVQFNLEELYDGVVPAPRHIIEDLEITHQMPVEEIALVVREFLGVSLNQQRQWTSIEAALQGWRGALNDCGVFVFKDAFKVDGYYGFSLFDAKYPIIFVNNSSAKTRQIFTIFHELAHLLFHTSGLDGLEDHVVDQLPGQSADIEVWCNRFAAEFLLPSTDFLISVDGRTPSREAAERIADDFKVSREVVYRRMLDNGMVTFHEYAAAVEEWNQQLGQRRVGGGGDYYWTHLSYLPRDYVSIAFQRFRQNRISERKLGEYLGVKPKNLPTLESYFLKSGE